MNKLKQKIGFEKLPSEVSILLILIGIGFLFEIVAQIMRDQTFLFNFHRVRLMILQVSVIGIIAVGVTQVIITTGIDLSSGSVLAFTAVVCAIFAQTSTANIIYYKNLTDFPAIIPFMMGLSVGIACGFINGYLVAKTSIPPFIATLGMMLMARGGSSVNYQRRTCHWSYRRIFNYREWL